ncbi:NAD-dependent epimerase/dehydratase family protein [Vibrio vulnificus]|uniref:NAD-dependent epimerase/dehydratase family protein n=1 Tax=Vibrio vulnificus TaxID=672 RepID=UPI00092C2B2A|nr:NAD-dependent epimerase/dehydratase family protein [Vibrio vulnificus]EJE8693663.1 NAD-dependent epimerase/dehydratase family protein [Vibrio vulnificus]OJI49980.1 UDP-glucose 4-epimerase [Vibrio vulnificus]POB21978.1 UDP-glucose 4-epimerase [Vibrio vulnificus]HAS8133304.1 NAD-dependent epimerase/dehydratase family protein [Vibrio vulnificus]
MSILLTGASGFIGSKFRNDNSVKRVVVRESDKARFWECERFVVNTINGKTSWIGAFEGIDVIIHLAGLAHSKYFTWEDYYSINVEGTLNLAKQAALAGVRRFVFVSTIGVYGTNSYNVPFSLKSSLTPQTDYARSKLIAETGLQKMSQELGIEIVIVRPTLVYGCQAPGNFSLLKKLVEFSPILPFRSIKNKRDFISAENLQDLLKCCALHQNAKGNIFLASEGETVSINEFTNHIAKGLNRRSFQLSIPISLFRLFGKLTGKVQLVEQLVGNLHVDNSNLKDTLGWVAPYTMKEIMQQLNKE